MSVPWTSPGAEFSGRRRYPLPPLHTRLPPPHPSFREVSCSLCARCRCALGASTATQDPHIADAGPCSPHPALTSSRASQASLRYVGDPVVWFYPHPPCPGVRNCRYSEDRNYESSLRSGRPPIVLAARPLLNRVKAVFDVLPPHGTWRYLGGARIPPPPLYPSRDSLS